MRPGLSTFVFFPDRLDTRLLDALRRAGAEAIEIVAARHHIDYTDRSSLRDLGRWFRDTGTLASLDQPRFADTHWSRHVGHNLNLLDPEKSRRIAAMDETKRALEAAEHIPFRSLTLYLGQRNDPWDSRALELSLTAIEHLKAFATPLNVQLLLENIDNDVTTPEHLLEILRVGHFTTVGITLDLGHAHLESSRHRTAPPGTPGIPSSTAAIDHALTLLSPRLVQLHLHDNDGSRDAHLPPGTLPTPIQTSGSNPKTSSATSSEDQNSATGVDWPHLAPRLAQLPDTVLGILELANDPTATPDTVTTRARTALDHLRRLTETGSRV